MGFFDDIKDASAAVSWLLQATLTPPPSGELYVPPASLYIPNDAIEIFEAVEEATRRPNSIIQLIYSRENEDGDLVVEQRNYRVVDVGFSSLQNDPFYQLVTSLLPPGSSNWVTRVAGLVRTSTVIVPYDSYVNPSTRSVLDVARSEGRFQSGGSVSGQPFNYLPWLLSGVGYAVGGPVGAPAGFVIGQLLSRGRPVPSPASSSPSRSLPVGEL
jgi:hypothetical protein